MDYKGLRARSSGLLFCHSGAAAWRMLTPSGSSSWLAWSFTHRLAF